MRKKRFFKQFRENILNPPPEDYKPAMREVRPFYWLLVAALVIQYGVTVYFSAVEWPSTRLGIFTGLMIVHGVLHWLSPHLTYKTMLTPLYVLTQSGLVLVIVLVADSVGLSYGLFAPLLGEILGVLRRSKYSILYGVILLFMSFLSFLLVRDMQLPWEWMMTAIPITFFVWVYVSLFTRQVLARERAQALLNELEIAHRQLADYADQVAGLTRDAERQRMARELHDTLAQGLAGLILQLEAADAHLSGGHSPKAQEIVQQAMTRARTTLADARKAIDDLRETTSTPQDMIAAIQDEVEQFRHTTGIRCTLDLCDPAYLSAELAENVLRTVSEGLMNIARHARASEAFVKLECINQSLFVEIYDNGIGFDAGRAVGESGHYGLLGMRERARNLGGSLTIESDSSRGTTLKLNFPLGVRHA